MDAIVHTLQIDADRTSIIVDVMNRPTGDDYVRIIQSITDKEGALKQAKIVLNPELLSHLIASLHECMAVIHNVPAQKQTVVTSNVVVKTAATKQKLIVASHLKGVPIEDIALRFNMQPRAIERILTLNNVVIVPKEELNPPYDPWPDYWSKQKKRKRS